MKKLVSLLLILTLALTLGGVASAEKKWEGHTIVFASWGDGAEKAATEKVIAAFEEATGCKVNYINISSDYDTKVTAMVAAGETIDCAQLESGSIAYPMAAEGLLEPLDSYIEDSGINMDDYVAASCYYDDNGNLIAWSGCIELMCLFYSRDVFDEAGLPYPPSDPDEAWTWDEFVDVATKLTKDANGLTPADEGFDPEHIVRYGVNPDIWWPVWGSFIASNGGSMVDSEGNFTMNQPEAVEALQALIDLKLVDHVAPSVTASQSLPASDVALLTGTYGMVIGGHGDTTMIPLVSKATVNGVPVSQFASKKKLEEAVANTMVGGATLTKLIGTSAWYAPGAAASMMVEAILHDQKKLVPCCCYLDGEYGQKDICIGVPAIIGRKGIEKIVKIDLSKEEAEKFAASADAVRKTNNVLHEIKAI